MGEKDGVLEKKIAVSAKPTAIFFLGLYTTSIFS